MLEFPPWPCVYVISAGRRRAKIGYSTDMCARFGALQMASPQRLRIIGTHPGTRATEAWLHKRFGKYRTHGEWFDLSSAAQADLMRLMNGDAPIPTAEVDAIERRSKAVSTGRKRHEAGQRFTGYAPSTGQPKYSKVKVTHFPPGSFPSQRPTK